MSQIHHLVARKNATDLIEEVKSKPEASTISMKTIDALDRMVKNCDGIFANTLLNQQKNG